MTTARDWRPSRLSALHTIAVVAAPVAGAIAAGALLGISWLVVVAVIVAIPSAMLLSRTYTIDLGIRPDRSWLSATLGMLHHTDPRGRLERLYVPVLAACVAGSLAELVLAGSAALGALEGGFLSLVMLLSWALACVVLSRRLGRAA